MLSRVFGVKCSRGLVVRCGLFAAVVFVACGGPLEGEETSDFESVSDEAVSCTQAHELPIVTHYSNSAGKFVYLASDQPNYQKIYSAPSGYVKGQCYPFYASIYPNTDEYVGETWSTRKIEDTEAKNVAASVCSSSGVPVRFLKPDAVGTRVVSKPGYVQVVHGIPIASSLITVMLPANWEKTKSYPIVANGFYDLNENVFRQDGKDIMKMIAQSTISGRTGAIGLVWNGGGAEASRTTNPGARVQFNDIVQFVKTNFGGDTQRILMTGGSRGGVTALHMASNPSGYPYKVTYVAAANPPSLLGEHALLQSTTYPGVLVAAAWSTGHHDAWHSGWTYPSCAGKIALTGLTAPQAHLKVLTGTTSSSTADASYSLLSETYLNGLKNAGTQVYLHIGSHDFIVPFAHQVQYSRELKEKGIPLELDVVLRSGHFTRFQNGWLATNDKLWGALQAYINPTNTTKSPTVTKGTNYFRVNRSTRGLDKFTPADGLFPFTFEGPRVIWRGGRAPLVMVGEPNTQWDVSITPVGGTARRFTGTIPSSGKSIQWVTVSATETLGNQSYLVKIKKPGKTWVTLANANTPTGSQAYMEVRDKEPNIDSWNAMLQTQGTTLSGYPNTNWGISEY